MKILIVAGGGGHFSPALAVIDKFPKDWEILVIGRKYTFEGDKSLSLEYQTAKKLGLPFEVLTTGRLQRKFTRHTFGSLFKLPVGFFQAMSVIKKFQPDVVLSFGGYVSLPVVYAAYLFHIPVILHEQTLGAGMANKIAAGFAKKICISWKQSVKYFPETKLILTGNPLRKEFVEHSKEPIHIDKDFPGIYITGGSSGSHAFNLLVEGCLEKLLQKYYVVHQTGDAKQFNDFDRLQRLKEQLPLQLQKRYMVVKFVDPKRVVDFLSLADLVVSRSGISTVTELLYLGKPCLLIPLPFGQQNEQLENALFVKSAGLAQVREQNNLTPDDFLTTVNIMMQDLYTYKKNAASAKKLIDIHASEKIVEVISHIYHANKEKNK